MYYEGVRTLDNLALKYWAHAPQVGKHFTVVEDLESWTNLEIDAQSSFDLLITLIDQTPNQIQTQHLMKLLYGNHFDTLLKMCCATRLSSFFKFCEVISKNHTLFTTTLLFLVKESKTKEACVFMDRLFLLSDMHLIEQIFSDHSALLVKTCIQANTKNLDDSQKQKEVTSASGIVLASDLTNEIIRLTTSLSRYPTIMPDKLAIDDYLDLSYEIRLELMSVFSLDFNTDNDVDTDNSSQINQDHDANSSTSNSTIEKSFPFPFALETKPSPQKDAKAIQQEQQLLELLFGKSLLGAGAKKPTSSKIVNQVENPLNLLLMPFDGQGNNNANTIDVEKILATKENVDESESYQWVSDETLHNMDYSDYSRETFSKAKKNIQSIIPMKPRLKVESLDIFDKLYDELPNFTEVIDFYKGNFILNQTKPKSAGYQVPTPILLVGQPGIGKTHFAEALAKCLATDSYFLDANSITASWVLSGSSPMWKEANIGYIFKYINECKTVSPVVIFDEIDKLSSNKNYDPFSTFHQLLEPLNAKKFRDEFLNLTFDASKFVYVLSANELNQIPDSLLSRMKVFHIQKPDEAQTRKIAQNIYTQLLDGSQLYKPQLSEENFAALTQYSPREIKQVLMDSIFSQAVKCSKKIENDLFIKSKHEKTKIGF